MSSTPTIVLVHGFWGGAAHWAKVIVALTRTGYSSIRAVENPLTSLRDDAERTRKMIAQVNGPVLLVGHSYGGAVITQAGDQPNVVGLVYIAAFAPDSGESLAQVMRAALAPSGAPHVAPDSDGFIWIDPAHFHESFCQDCTADDALVMAVTQKVPVGATFGDQTDDSRVEDQALLVSDFKRGPDDPSRQSTTHVGAHPRAKDHCAARRSRFARFAPHRSRVARRRSRPFDCGVNRNVP